MDVNGQVALVTGAGGGIGGALIKVLLDGGARRVVAADLTLAPELEAWAAREPRLAVQRLDVTSETAVSAVADDNRDVSILVNCHGLVIHEGFLEAVTLSAFRKEMEVNYWGQVLMCRAFAGILGDNGGGALVNFLSPLAYITMPFCGSYCASKAAARALTEALRAELSVQGTHVMSVCPGATDTPMIAGLDIPKSGPDVVARAVIDGLRIGELEVWAGEGAEDMRRQFLEEPRAQAAAAARQLRRSEWPVAAP